MFAAILQDAWRQYRRRPLAIVLSVALGLVQVPLTLAGETAQLVITIPLLVVNLLLELFLIAYLAGALSSEPVWAPAALAAARRSFLPGVRAFLLKGIYAVPAFLIGILLLGPRDTGPLPASRPSSSSAWPRCSPSHGPSWQSCPSGSCWTMSGGSCAARRSRTGWPPRTSRSAWRSRWSTRCR